MGKPVALQKFVAAYEQLAKAASGDGPSADTLPERILIGETPIDPRLVGKLVAISTHLARTGRKEQALTVANAGKLIPADTPPIALAVAQLSFILNDYDNAEKLIRKFSGRFADPNWVLLEASISLYKEEIPNARAKAAEYASARPVVPFSPRENQSPKLCILKTHPEVITDPFAIRYIHLGGNFISQFVRRFPDKFNVTTLLANAETAALWQSRMPKPDIVVNNMVGGEMLGDPALKNALQEAADRWGVYCVNRPEAAYETARDKIQDLLADEPNIVAPKTRFFRFDPKLDTSTKVDRIFEGFKLPVILRSPFFQNGVEMALCRTREELEQAIEKLQTDFFAISFIESRHKGGYYRKIRAAWIGDKLHLLRLDYGEDWMLHGHRNEPHRVAFYRDHPEFLEEEIAICSDPAAHLGKTAMSALKTIRSKIQLDYFGVDFDVMTNGKLLLFEANAIMNLMGKPYASLRHPEFAEAAMVADFVELLNSKMSLNRTL